MWKTEIYPSLFSYSACFSLKYIHICLFFTVIVPYIRLVSMYNMYGNGFSILMLSYTLSNTINSRDIYVFHSANEFFGMLERKRCSIFMNNMLVEYISYCCIDDIMMSILITKRCATVKKFGLFKAFCVKPNKWK